MGLSSVTIDGSVRDRVLSPIRSINRLQEMQVETGAKWSIASGTTADLGETYGRENVSQP